MISRTDPRHPAEPALHRTGGDPIFVGITTLDVIHRMDVAPMWGRKAVASSTELAAGGPAANAAVTCAAILGSATLLSALGESPAAGLAGADLAVHGVNVLDCAATDFAIPVASAVLQPGGDRTVFSTGATSSTAVAGDAALAALAAAPVILLDGHHPSLAEAALEVATRGRVGGAGPVVVLDAGSVKPHAERWLDRLDVLAASADYVAGLGLSTDEAIEHGLDGGASVVIVTDGPGPVVWRRRASGPASSGSWQPPSVPALDTLGAGDAFHGALVAALAITGRDWPSRLDRIVQRAGEVASRRVCVPGARAWLRSLPERDGEHRDGADGKAEPLQD